MCGNIGDIVKLVLCFFTSILLNVFIHIVIFWLTKSNNLYILIKFEKVKAAFSYINMHHY